MIQLKYMTSEDREFVMRIDKDMSQTAFEQLVYTKSGYIIWKKDVAIGIMMHCVFWGKIPFLNLLYLKEEERGNGFGKKAMELWENDMKQQGYQMVLVSTQADETAQFFYRKSGYVDCGCLVFHQTPFEQPTELFMRKVFA